MDLFHVNGRKFPIQGDFLEGVELISFYAAVLEGYIGFIIVVDNKASGYPVYVVSLIFNDYDRFVGFDQCKVFDMLSGCIHHCHEFNLDEDGVCLRDQPDIRHVDPCNNILRVYGDSDIGFN
ncbi:18267_t:CDS:2 [Funneliformis geosporum]|uniref:18267_t:CDS:1 n=1 Tax=Funneliformis geosporum TaxID=1117311 RepID=A0A9W4SUA6_9GLOM|nr:18267_t:CDS:2 [Funneliformis geosporum]